MGIMIEKQFEFEAAHRLPNVPEGHQCGRLHGHSYTLVVGVSGEVDPTQGWILDFAVLKEFVAPLVKQLDHHTLNDVVGLDNPTSENLALWFAEALRDKIPGLARVVVSETASSRCELTL